MFQDDHPHQDEPHVNSADTQKKSEADEAKHRVGHGSAHDCSSARARLKILMQETAEWCVDVHDLYSASQKNN